MRLKKFPLSLGAGISSIRDSYVNFLLDYSWHVIALMTLISVSLSAYSMFFYWNTFTFNPTIGFETRGTYLSNQRLALDNLIRAAAGKDDIKSRSKRAVEFVEALGSDKPENSSFTIPEDYADYGFSDDSTDGSKYSEQSPETAPGACQQYFVLGTVIPYETITFMSKLIFKVPSFNSLFNMRIMQRLCAIDSIVDGEIRLSGLNTTQLKRLPFSFNLPYYTMCLNMQLPSNSCYSLNPDDIEMFKSLVLTCQTDDAPLECQLPIAQQLSSMIFQKGIGPADLDKPMYIAVILPITLSFDGRSNLDFYSRLLERLQEDYRGDELRLMGAQFGVKDGLFERKIRGDARLGVVAILLVVFIVLLYTNSFFFTFCIAAGLILSIGVAFFVYTVIFGVKFFPFLNLLAMILVVAVGADDAFLFMYQYRKHKKEASEKWSPVSNCDTSSKPRGRSSDKDELLEYHRRQVLCGLSEALSHAAIAMFVTSATTAVAFFANLASKIMVLRCFGIYAGTMMLINYVLVITILPAAIIVTDARTKSFSALHGIVSRLRTRIAKFWRAAARCFDLAFAKLIPRIVSVIRIPLIPLALAAFAASIYAIIKTPGIRLPEKNSMQFLRSNHPYEWFDEHATTLFDFSNGQRLKMSVIAIWGIKPTTSASALIPADIGSLDVDAGFADAMANHLINFQALLKNLSNESNGRDTGTEELWLDGFIRWTQLGTTSRGCQLLSENRTDTSERHSLTADMLTRCLLLYGQTASLPVFDELQRSNGDGPIFDKNGAFLAYFLVAKSVYNFSTVFNEMKPFFDFLDVARRLVLQRSNVSEFRDPLLLTSRQMTSLYDLLERILNGTAISVLISLVVSTLVIVFTTLHLSLSALAIVCIATVVTATIATVLWLGWTVNVVEATIIVLTIGMSFDYCLHFAVGFRLHGTNEYSAVASAVGVPVLLAAVSSFVAGLALIGASTQAFFEIGVFLMLMTAISFLVAVFVFPSMVTSLLHRCSPVRTTTRL